MSDRRTPSQSIPTRRQRRHASIPGLGTLMHAIRGFRSIARSRRTLPLSDPASSPFRSSATSADHNRPLIDHLAAVIERTRRETERVKHADAGTEHLLLALASLALSPVNENEWLLWRLFSGLRVHPLWVIQEVEFRFGYWEKPTTDDPPLMPTISQAIQVAHEKARRRGNRSKHITDEIPLTPLANHAIELARH